MGLSTICDALESDLPAIKSLEAACNLSPWPEADYRKMLNGTSDEIFLTAKDNRRIVGFLLMRLITKSKQIGPIDSATRPISSTHETPSNCGEAEICNIAVDKSQRRRGIAAKLLQEAVCRSMERGNYTIFLEVRESNRPAIGFYLANGFEKVGLRKGYYSSPIEDAWIMRLSAKLKC